jgi:hypothetical protein
METGIEKSYLPTKPSLDPLSFSSIIFLLDTTQLSSQTGVRVRGDPPPSLLIFSALKLYPSC